MNEEDSLQDRSPLLEERHDDDLWDSVETLHEVPEEPTLDSSRHVEISIGSRIFGWAVLTLYVIMFIGFLAALALILVLVFGTLDWFGCLHPLCG